MVRPPRIALLLALLLVGCPTDPPVELVDVPGCDGAVLAETDPDPSAPGPWPVGARTVSVGDFVVSVHYPAEPGSEADLDTLSYDVRPALPPSQQRAIPDADNPVQDCDCWADLPLDPARGPYPVVVFIHGTAGWETQSLTQLVHWASRGFVVLSARHPGLFLGDLLALACPDEATRERDLGADVDAMLAALASPAGDLAFLDGFVDLDRVGLAGHSAGGNAVAELADRPGVRAVVPMASSAPVGGTDRTVLFLGGEADTVVAWDATIEAYEATDGPASLVGLADAGHLAFADLCDFTNGDGQNLVEIAEEHAICGVEFAGALFDCNPDYLDGDVARTITNWTSTAVFQETLQCRSAPPLADVEAAFPAATVRTDG